MSDGNILLEMPTATPGHSVYYLLYNSIPSQKEYKYGTVFSSPELSLYHASFSSNGIQTHSMSFSSATVKLLGYIPANGARVTCLYEVV